MKTRPFAPGGGAGLGLAIAAALSRHNSGHLTANHPEGGAVLTLTLPLAAHQTPRRHER